jgi:non-ribosomal peptide synthetase component F/acyl carrier protein
MTLTERFEAQARARPDALAIAGPTWQPTFAELSTASNGWARAVLERCGPGEGRVALLLTDGARLVAAALGVLKAGKTAVVVSPSDPLARLERILDDAEPEALVAARAVAGLPLIDEPGKADPVPSRAEAGSVAFLIYTSGSTGEPKGVMQTHGSMLHNVLRHTAAAGLTERDRVLQLASAASGQGVGLVWSTLLNGATLCPFPAAERGLAGLSSWVRERGVTVFVASASLLRTFVRTLAAERFDQVRLVRIASEAASWDDVALLRRHFPHSAVLNTFSTSETGTLTRWLVEGDEPAAGGVLPVGRPAEGIELLLDDGEIVVRSDFLSPGYWRKPTLTAERFAENGRLFRTGDLGRIDEHGLLTIVGRTDFRVKVHGFNVDLSEVEAALAAQAGVAAAAVRAERSARGDTKLRAFVSVTSGNGVTGAALRDALRATLPAHAVPSSISLLDELPLAPSGKVDRSRLAEPQTETEELLAALFAEALELDEVAPDDDFFELGGDSLAAAVVAAGVSSALGTELELRAFAEAPTPRRLARLVEGASDRPRFEPPARAKGDMPAPASPVQERAWRVSQRPAGALAFNMSGLLRLSGPLDVDALRRALDEVSARHEVLRTVFEERAGSVVQVVEAPGPVELRMVDVESDRHAEAVCAAEAARPFDLGKLPLLRLVLARVDEHEHYLIRTNHHIVSDGWSWRVFFDELARSYAGERLEPLELQYRDFAVWQRSLAETERARRSIEWWRETLAEPHRPLAPPFERTAPPMAVEPDDGLVWWGLFRETSAALDSLARRCGATFFMSRLAVLAALLGLETEREDLVLGTAVTNRRFAQLQALFGDFTNLAMLRLRFDPNAGFREWLASVRARVLETSEHVDLPSAVLHERLAAEGVAVPELRVVLSRTHQLPAFRLGEVEVTQLPTRLQLTPTGCTILSNRSYESHACHAYFDPRSYERRAVAAFVVRYERFARAVAAEPDRPLGSVRDSIQQSR